MTPSVLRMAREALATKGESGYVTRLERALDAALAALQQSPEPLGEGEAVEVLRELVEAQDAFNLVLGDYGATAWVSAGERLKTADSRARSLVGSQVGGAPACADAKGEQ